MHPWLWFLDNVDAGNLEKTYDEDRHKIKDDNDDDEGDN